MACNAWNHPKDCSCGWGGVYYGTNQRLTFPHPSTAQDWKKNSTKLLSYTNPNARCPVCGSDVFFYASPDGGRVYFDYLGPPWEKHPCTDTSFSSVNQRRRARYERNRRKNTWKNLQDDASQGEWLPLIYNSKFIEKHFVVFEVGFNFPIDQKRYVLVESRNWESAPIFFRWRIQKPLQFELNWQHTGPDNFTEERSFRSPSWLTRRRDIDRYIKDRKPNASDLLKVAKMISFDWEELHPKTWSKLPQVDLIVAIEHLEKASELGSPKASYLLSRIYREGLSVKIDLERSKHYEQKASNSTSVSSLQELRRLF